MKIIFSLFISMFWIVLPLAAQSDVDKYTERFNKGEREINFMREYVLLLQQNKKINLLEKAADAYLSQISIEERYKDANLTLFRNSVKDYKAQSFRDLIINWEKCSTKENSTVLSDKVKQVYASTIFSYIINKKQSDEEFKKMMAEDIKNIEPTQKELCSLLLDIFSATEKRDITQILKIAKERVVKLSNKTLEVWTEAQIIGTALNYVLENGDITQCKELLKTLEVFRNDDHSNYIDTICDNLDGKIVMSE